MRRLELAHDCARCDALCCVATSFEASEDFAMDKPAGVPCLYLGPDRRCGIHDDLAAHGFGGCAVYGCHGAGQRVTAELGGRPEHERNAAFLSLRVVHELLWLLTGAVALCPPTHRELRATIEQAIGALERVDVRDLPTDDALQAHRDAAHALLRRIGDAIRAS